MIAWQNPAAFIGLIALVGPIILHLLQRQRAVRLPFPSDRFIRAAVTGAVRLRLPSDVLLLAIRGATLAAAVCAFAQPVLVTPGRMRAWDAKIARAVVFDVSESMATAAGVAAAAVDDEMRGATTVVRIESTDVGDGVRRAVAGLAHAAPARREIVVISDFQNGVLSPPAIAAVPPSMGLRFVRVGQPLPRRQISGPSLLGSDGRGYRPQITVDANRTSVVFERTPGESDGLRIVAGGGDAVGLVRAVAASGAPGPSREQPMTVTFGSPTDMSGSTFESPWMLATALRLRRDPELSPLSRSGPFVQTSASGNTLAVGIGTSPDSYEAAVAMRSVLRARQGDAVQMFAENEVRTIADRALAAWSRRAPPVDSGAWRYAPDTDARWFWGLVVALLALETAVRGRAKA